jgi:hypothetical protein
VPWATCRLATFTEAIRQSGSRSEGSNSPKPAIDVANEILNCVKGRYHWKGGGCFLRPSQLCATSIETLHRLLPQLRQNFPQLRLWLSGDSLYVCGRTLQLAKDYHCNYVLTFKPSHMPAVWQDFQALLKLCPGNELTCSTPQGVHQVYRWVHGLSYQDDQGRTWHFNAIECTEVADGETIIFAWITDLKVDTRTVEEIATKGGRHHWHIENQGFNRQKNSGLNLERAFSTDPERLKAYYYLLQLAHTIMQILEVGSLLRNAAVEFAWAPMQLFGSLKNLARRLLKAFRYIALSDEVFDHSRASSIQIRFDTS